MFVIAFSGHRNKSAHEGDLQDLLDACGTEGIIWIHGGAQGFDKQVDRFATSKGVNTGVFKPAYNKPNQSPKYAPLARNLILLDLTDQLVILWDGRQSGGTYFTYQEALKRGIRVTILDPEDEECPGF
jgi:hypothetical protein